MSALLVVDASVAAKWVLAEPGSEAARLLTDEFTLIAPDTMLLELCNVMSRRERRKLLTAAQTDTAFDLLVELSPLLYPTQPLVAAAFELSRGLQISFWDTIYLALALDRACGLITADQRFFHAVVGKYPLVQLLDSPGFSWQH